MRHKIISNVKNCNILIFSHIAVAILLILGSPYTNPAYPSPFKPSFDCNKAKYSDEVAICSEPILAKLESEAKIEFDIYKKLKGENKSIEIARNFQKKRRLCNQDILCIKNSLEEAKLFYARNNSQISDRKNNEKNLATNHDISSETTHIDGSTQLKMPANKTSIDMDIESARNFIKSQQDKNKHVNLENNNNDEIIVIVVTALALLVFCVTSIIWIGYKKNAIIYGDGYDLMMNIIPVPILITGLLMTAVIKTQNIGQFVFNATIILVAIIIFINFIRSIFYNRFLPLYLNIYIAIIKFILTAIAIFFITAFFSNSRDKNKTSIDRVQSASFAIFVATLMASLINGKDVAQKKGFSYDPFVI